MIRINNEFERITRMLQQRKQYLTKQISIMFDELAKNSISDIATAESQAEYGQHLLTNLLNFLNTHFDPNKKQDIITLNTDYKNSVPRMAKELYDLKKTFCKFKHCDKLYPQFQHKIEETVDFIKGLGELINVSGYSNKSVINPDYGIQPNIDRSPTALFMTSSTKDDFIIQYNISKGTWMRPIMVTRKTAAPEFYKYMIATVLPTSDIALTGGMEPHTLKGIKKCKIFKRSNLSIESVQPLLNARYAHAAVELCGYLYVFGGNDLGGKLTACEKYKYIEREIQKTAQTPWVPIASMNIPRVGLAACVFNKRAIYVFGGDQLTTLEKYNVYKNTWEVLPAVNDIDPSYGLTTLGIFKVEESEEIAIFGTYYAIFYDTATRNTYSKSDHVILPMERALASNKKVIIFTKEAPQYSICYSLKPLNVISKTPCVRHSNDIEIRAFPAAITQGY